MPYAQDLDTGEWIEVDAQGNPVADTPSQGGVFTLPPDPVEQARLANENRRVSIAEGTAAQTAAMQPLREDLLRAQIRSAEAAAAKAEQGTAGAQAGDARQQARLANLNALVEQINRVQELYEAGPGTTEPWSFGALGDLLPTAVNKQFNAASAGLAEQGLAAFRVPGVGAQSDTELRQFVQANRPSASDFDAEIEEKLRQLRNRVDATRQSMGLDPARWQAAEEDRQNALTMPRVVDGGGSGAAGFGATEGLGPVPPAYQQAYDAFVRSGNWTPEQYAAFRSQLDKAFFPNASDQTETYLTEGQRIRQTLDKGGSLNLNVPGVGGELSEVEQFRNNLVSNPVGAAAVGAADMGSFGLVSALSGDRMQALGEEQAVPMMLGQIGGAITGTGLLAKGAREAAGKLAPSLLGGGAKAQFGRDLATDVAYSGIYGGVSEGDPVNNAVIGAAGSLGGQIVGKGLGAAVGGANVAPAVEALRSRGIRMTVPQQLGGFVKSIEDKATSVPLIGDMIRARRIEGIEDFNRQAFNDAGQPINARVAEIGNEGVQALSDQVSNAYDSATSGVTVPLDGPFMADMQNVAGLAQQLPDDYRALFAKTLENRVAPITDGGQISGYQYQQATRALKNKRATADRATPGFEDEYRDALTGTIDALTGPFMRQGGDSVISGLQSANAANRNLRTLEDAATRAAGGSETGTPFVFTPSQLQRAGLKTEQKYPGARPFADLADNAQAVLPSRIPDSGTGGRIAQMALPGALAGGAGLGLASSGDMQGAGGGALYSALATLALLAGGTRAGQKALDMAVISRPPVLKNAGKAITRRKGLFGHAAQPFVLED